MRDQAGAPRKYRIGIDVGGTFTKAVLIDNATRAIVGRYSVKTTHDDTRGVAAGVVDVFRNVLQRSGVSPGDVVFIAHSTTQATNALLEGDVAKVGVLGMAGGSAAKLAEQQVHIDPIELAPGRTLETANTFVNSDNASLRQSRTPSGNWWQTVPGSSLHPARSASTTPKPNSRRARLHTRPVF